MNDQFMKVSTSKNSDEWTTPVDLFKQLDQEFHFNLDPCATIENHLCENYFTKNEDGLSKSWKGMRVFCNPPYSEIKQWVHKALKESREDYTLIVMLVPARTDTRWFHHFVYGRCEIRFLPKRVKFGGKANAPFPSMILIFRGGFT